MDSWEYISTIMTAKSWRYQWDWRATFVRKTNNSSAIPEAQLSAWIRADESHGGLVDIPVLLLRPQLNVSPYYFAPEAGFQILFLYVKAGYAFPWGKMSENYPFDTGKFRFSVGAIIPLNIK